MSTETDETIDTFATATAVRPIGDGAYEVEISDQWKAGRGPHGGYLAAIIVRALTARVAERERAPRSLTIHYLRAPQPGPAQVRTAIERAGRNLTTLSARLEQDGKLMALALAAFSLPWEAPELDDEPMPDVAPPEPRPEERIPRIPMLPRFTSHMVMQPRFGPIPFTGSTEPMEAGGWLGLFEPYPIDAAALALFCDAWWSPPFGRVTARGTSPTIDLTIHFRRPLPPEDTTPGGLVLARFRTGLVHDGFFDNDATIWDGEGRLLAQARQLALLLMLE